MTYDYGVDWTFNIELIDISELGRGKGKSYSKIVSGEGKGIIEDVHVGILLDYIKHINAGGELPMALNNENEFRPWDYREFNLEYMNYMIKCDVRRIQDAYEVPLYYTYEYDEE